MKNKEKIIEEFRKKWGRFYISDTIKLDWIKPEKCLHKSGVFCIASDDIEKDIIEALSLQKQEIVKEIEKLEIARPNSEREKGVYEIKCAWLSEVKDQLKQTLNK